MRERPPYWSEEARRQRLAATDARRSRKACWFVEAIMDGNGEGWYTAPKEGVGGWITTNPLEAKRYTRSEAIAVAQALSYFHVPFRWSKWRATEHAFMPQAERSGR